jgi:Tol biopolymer transport system component
MNTIRNLVTSAFVAVVILGSGDMKADFTFGEPVNLGSVFAETDTILCFSRDGLEVYLAADRPGGYGGGDLWVRRRATPEADWGPPQNLGPAVNSASDEYSTSISADGLALYFESDRPGGSGWDIYMTTRATKNDPWGEAVALSAEINQVSSGEPWISPDGLELYFNGYGHGGFGSSDMWVTKRATENDPWGTPVNLGPTVNGPYDDHYLSLSPDGLLLFFCEYFTSAGPFRADTYGMGDIWMARRASLSAPWQAPVNLGPKVNSSTWDLLPRVSPDGRTLYFWNALAGNGYWLAPIIPVVDFNGDGKVDDKDDSIMAACLGRKDPLCDIGPFAWGDGVVDAKDQAVLTEYMGQPIEDPTLLAHWALDETEGTVARDSAGTSDAAVIGNGRWQPEGGKVAGALQLSGTATFVVTKLVHDPSRGPFSVLAWVKGGAPGQTILSQTGGANWLSAQPGTGFLMSDLKLHPLLDSLVSPTVVTDGAWHRVGFVWDGANRLLYVDGVEVARSPQSTLPSSTGGLQIGAGSTLTPGTFWSGLIDDVRIYNRVVRP